MSPRAVLPAYLRTCTMRDDMSSSVSARAMLSLSLSLSTMLEQRIECELDRDARVENHNLAALTNQIVAAVRAQKLEDCVATRASRHFLLVEKGKRRRARQIIGDLHSAFAVPQPEGFSTIGL